MREVSQMETAYRSLPGFYEIKTRETEPCIPQGKIRLCQVVLTAVDIDGTSPRDAGTSFTILAALAEEDRRFAQALLGIAEHVRQNRKMIEDCAKR